MLPTPAAPSQLSDVAITCRLIERPKASFGTVCGVPSKQKASSAKKSAKTGFKDRAQSSNTVKETKLKKGCIFVAEDTDGSVLFNFKPDLGSKPPRNHLTVLSPGQQHLTRVKLSRVASGSSGQLTFQLWDTATNSSAASASAQDSTSPSQGLHHPDTSVPHHEAGNQEHVPVSQATREPPGSTSDTLSLLLGTAPSSSHSHSQPDTAPQYAFAATRDSSQASASSAQQPTLLQKPLVRPTPVQKPGQEPGESPKPARRPALLQKPVRPPTSEVPTAVPDQDVATARSHQNRNAEKWVPCYLWHESGLPKKKNLKDFPYEFIGGDTDDEVSTSDSPDSVADSSSELQALEAAPANAIQKAWRPIRQLLLRMWRLLPYWLRSRFHSQQRQEPAVHASRILAQHTLAAPRDQAVEGSTWDLSTGRSLTPLADVERYQIEDLIKMGVKDLELFRTALTSPSALPQEKVIAASFDRLEYLGDAVVSLAFRSWVYARFPEDDEGSMTNTANTLVSNRAHVLYANHINLTSHIAQNLRHHRPNSRINEEVVADAFEALVGAIYLDKGLQAARKFIIELAQEVMGLEQDLSSYRNYKLYLVNAVNENDLGRVSYQSKKRQQNMWQSKCRLQGKLVGIGLDKQRKQAESAAAYAAMEELGFTDIITDPAGYRPPRHADRKPFLRPSPETPDAPASVSKDQLPKDQLVKDQPPREHLAKDQPPREQLAKDQPPREQLAKDQPPREQLAKDKLGSDQPGKGQLSTGQLSHEQLSKDKLSREQSNRSQVSRERLLKERMHKDQLSRNQMAKQQLPKHQGNKDKPSAGQTEAN